MRIFGHSETHQEAFRRGLEFILYSHKNGTQRFSSVFVIVPSVYSVTIFAVFYVYCTMLDEHVINTKFPT
jgi:hypothetical protein